MNEPNPAKCLKRANIKGPYVVINQVTEDGIHLVNREDSSGKIISIRDKGTSKSRNLALKSARSSGIALLADDDMVYNEDCDQIIEDAYQKYKNADAIAFSINYEKPPLKKKILKEGRLNYREALTLNTVRFSFKLDVIKKLGLCFDERFGPGTPNIMGEDSIFISDCFRKGMKIYYVDQTIGTLTELHESGWFKSYNEEYFRARGAMLQRLSPKIGKLFILRFAILKYNIYRKDMNFKQAISHMLKGARDVRHRNI